MAEARIPYRSAERFGGVDQAVASMVLGAMSEHPLHSWADDVDVLGELVSTRPQRGSVLPLHGLRDKLLIHGNAVQVVYDERQPGGRHYPDLEELLCRPSFTHRYKSPLTSADFEPVLTGLGGTSAGWIDVHTDGGWRSLVIAGGDAIEGKLVLHNPAVGNGESGTVIVDIAREVIGIGEVALTTVSLTSFAVQDVSCTIPRPN